MIFPRCYLRMERRLKKVGVTVMVFAIIITFLYVYEAEIKLTTTTDKRNNIVHNSDKLELSKNYVSAFPEKVVSAKKIRKEDDNTEGKSNVTITEDYFGFPRNISSDIENELFLLSEHEKTFWDSTTNLTTVATDDENYTEIYSLLDIDDGKENVYSEATASSVNLSTNGIVTLTSDRTATAQTPDIYTGGEPTLPARDAMSQNPEDSWLDDRQEGEFALRTSHLKDVCRQFNVQQNASAIQVMSNVFQIFNNSDTYVEYVSSDNFRLARSASTMTCLINKVASTSVAVALLQADGRPVPDWTEALSPHNAATVLKPKTQAEFNFARKHFFKFLLVRHPFERLLSAYRDKVERANHWSLKELRQHISNSLREAQKETSEHPPPALGNGGTSEGASATDQQDDRVPTFSDFLEYILTTNLSDGGFDSHWAPYWRTCSPCSVSYDVIAKLETADLDLKPVWQRMGLQWTSLPQYNRSSAGGSPSRSDTVDRYYRGLRPTLIAKVYRRFALDFHLFQYDIMDVFRQGGHCQTHECSEMISYL